jgi:NADH dehydrogenase
VLFGDEDILINNIAWLLRTFPVFGVFGDGKYRLQPIFVDDFAALAVEQGKSRENRIINAIGPETFTYRELVTTISEIILGKKRTIISIPDSVGLAVGKLVGWLTGDVVITREEIQGLKSELLYVEDQPAGMTSLTEWLREHRDIVGKRYAGELARRK